jgi:hypothetical protein
VGVADRLTAPAGRDTMAVTAMRHLPLCLLLALSPLGLTVASAQPVGVTTPAATAPSPELDLRLGALWPEDGAEPRPAVGGRLALRPWASTLSGRLSAQFTIDFRSFGGQDGFDDLFQVRRRITRNRLLLAAGIGVDLLRTARTTVDVRAGGAIVRTRTNFLIDSSQGFVFDNKIWENVCPFEGFRERCSTSYDVTPAFSLGLRRDLVASGFTYIGADYTALGLGQHVLMGTIGMRLR